MIGFVSTAIDAGFTIPIMKYFGGKRGMLAAAVMTLALSPALAGDLEDGMEAYDGGDYALALAAWTRAAAAGQADAMVAIADLHANGVGVARDPGLALTWYRRAARLGDATGQLNLGDMIARGLGQDRDPVEASMWLGLAAGQGNRWAADRKRELARSMTPAEVALAERRTLEWRPIEAPGGAPGSD